jgi:hypothetical protein
MLVFLLLKSVSAYPSPSLYVGITNLAQNIVSVQVVAPSNYSNDTVQILVNGTIFSTGKGTAWYNFTMECGPTYNIQGNDRNLGTYSQNDSISAQNCTLQYPTFVFGPNTNLSKDVIQAVVTAPQSSDYVRLLVNGNATATGTGMVNYTFEGQCGAKYSFQAYDMNQATYSPINNLTIPCTVTTTKATTSTANSTSSSSSLKTSSTVQPTTIPTTSAQSTSPSTTVPASQRSSSNNFITLVALAVILIIAAFYAIRKRQWDRYNNSLKNKHIRIP